MQLSDVTNSQGIFQDVYFLTRTDSTSYATNDIVRNANRWAYKAVTWILRSSNRWSFDDSNFGSLPTITDTLVDGEEKYDIASNLLNILRVEVIDSDGTKHKLKEISIFDIQGSLDEYKKTSGLPSEYLLLGNKIVLKPAPAAADVTTASGLIFYVSREIDVFAVTDTAQEPGFAEPFHRIVSHGAAYDFFVRNQQMEKADRMTQEIQLLKQELYEFYGDRNRDKKINLNPAHRQEAYI